MIRGIKRLGLAIAVILATIAHARSEGIYNPSANAVGDYQGVDSNSSSGGGGGCSQATSFLARKSGTTNNAAYTTYICGLVTDGVWAKLDALYVFAGDTQANSLLSLVSATYNGTITGSVTFVAGGSGTGGFSSATGGLVDTNFKPSTASSPFYVQNSASIFVWDNDAASRTSPVMGSNGGGLAYIYADDGGTAFYGVNANAFTCTATVVTGAGFIVVSRTGASALDGYVNGVLSSAGCTVASTGVPAVDIVFGAGDAGTSVVSQYAIGGIGGALTSTDISKLYARTHTLLQTIAGYP